MIPINRYLHHDALDNMQRDMDLLSADGARDDGMAAPRITRADIERVVA